MAELYIFDSDDTLITILSNEGEEACPFWDAPFREELNQGSTFQFTAQGDHPDSKHLKAENQVAFKDKDGDFRLFVIKEPERMDSEDGPIITCVCEPAMLELNDDMVYDENNAKEIYELAPKNVTLKTVVTRILKHTRWKVGEIAELGLNTTHFFYLNATEALMKAINTWGGEFRDRVTVEGSTITGRYIDILPRRGADTGKRWEMDKDILSIRHQIQSYPKTALIGRGAGIAQTDAEGEETGGYSRKISFADVEWKKANGDPADKPKGQKWVGDLSALALFGRKDADGSRRHRIGIYETDTEDPNELLRETWEALQNQKNQLSNFELDVFLLEEITGYEHEKVRLGDTSFSIDRRFAEPIEAEERVIVFEYDIASPDETGKVEMGQFIDLYADEKRLDDIEAVIKEKGPQWDNGGNRPITDDKIENVTPTQPKNLIATGSFKNVIVEWDFVGTIAIQHYEVYASQIQGFTPDPSNLVYRGKTSIYTHKADSNQQWYFRVRAVNTHNVPGPFSAEAAAQTARIITDDILFGAVNAAILADLAVEASKLAGSAVTAEKIANAAVGNAAIQNLAVTNAKIGNFAVGEGQIENLAVTNAKIANLAVDDAKISNLSVSKLKAGTLDASKITIYGGSTTDYTRIDGSLFESRGRFRRTWLGTTKNHDVRIRTQNGYLRLRNDTLNRSLYLSDFGMSTYVDGEGEEGGSSGSILWWDTTYSDANANGITVNSYGGVAALSSDLNRVMLDAKQSVNLNSRDSTIIFRPYERARPGTNVFLMSVADSSDTAQTHGYIMYGSEDNRSVGFRYYKGSSAKRIEMVDGDYASGGETTLGAGIMEANTFYNRDRSRMAYMNGSGTGTTLGKDPRNTLIASGIRTNDSDFFIATDSGGSVRVTNAAGYNNGDGVTYRPIVASEFVQASSRVYKKDINLYEESAVDIVKSHKIYQYRLKNSEGNDDLHIGFIAEESPAIRKDDTVSKDKAQSIAWKALQEVIERLEKVEAR